jgi:hypothetical protein
MRARELEGPHPEANQPKRPTNTPPTNQRQAHGLKGPSGRPNGCAKARITKDQHQDPPASQPEEGRAWEGSPRVNPGSAEPR